MQGNGVADYNAGYNAVKTSNYVFISYELSNRYFAAANDCSVVSVAPFGIVRHIGKSVKCTVTCSLCLATPCYY